MTEGPPLRVLPRAVSGRVAAEVKYSRVAAVPLDHSDASSAPSMPPDTTSLSASDEASELLARVRREAVDFPQTPAAALVSRLRPPAFSWTHEENSAPSPPPPISFLSHPRPPNPNIISALLLQVVILGATTLGLIRRRNASGKEGDVPSPLDVASPVILGPSTDLAATNLVLSSWAERGSCSRALLDEVKALESINHSLASMRSQELDPNHWTIIALLAFVTTPPAPASVEKTLPLADLVPPTRTKYELARPILALWAWRRYSELRSSESEPPKEQRRNDHTILESFIDLLSDSKFAETLEHDIATELVEGMFGLVGDGSRTSLMNQRFRLGQIAISHRVWSVPRQLLTPLAPPSAAPLLQPATTSRPLVRATDRLTLCLELLQMIKGEERSRGDRDGIMMIAEALLAITQELSAPRTFQGKSSEPQIVSKSDALAPLRIPSVAPAGECVFRPLRPADVARLEEAVGYLLEGFGIDRDPSKTICAIVTIVLRHSTERLSLSPEFLLRLLDHLITSRNPRLALALFDNLPPRAQTLALHNAVLRSHLARVSQNIWDRLLHHPTLVPTADSFYARLVSHADRTNHDLVRARDDLRRMKEMSLPRRTDIWNKLLKLVSNTGSELMFMRQWRRMADARVELDVKTFTILAADKLNKHAGVRQIKDLAKEVEALERQKVGRRGERGLFAKEVTANLAFKAISRWSFAFNADKLCDVAERMLADTASSRAEPSDKPSRAHYETVRRPIYRLLAKGLGARGDFVRRQRAIERMRDEERGIRERERKHEGPL